MPAGIVAEVRAEYVFEPTTVIRFDGGTYDVEHRPAGETLGCEAEGVAWIRGHHARSSPEVAAMLTAFELTLSSVWPSQDWR